MENQTNLIIGGLIGYLFGNFIGGSEAGERGRLHWDWFLNTCKIHLHHWIIMSVLLIIYLQWFCGDNLLVIGVLFGGIAHGLSYSDRFKILC